MNILAQAKRRKQIGHKRKNKKSRLKDQLVQNDTNYNQLNKAKD